LIADRTGAELAPPRHAERDEPIIRSALDRALVGALAIRQALRPAAGMAGADADLGDHLFRIAN
jgi:hypothetical protein